MLGDLANNLVIDSYRSQQTRSIIAYNTTTVRLISREAKTLDDQLVMAAAIFENTQVEYDEGQAAELTITALALRRNRRALSVYHHQRCDVIVDKLWEAGGLLGVAFKSNTDSRKHLATVDEAFAKSYETLLLEYRNDPGLATDILSGGVEDALPPLELFVKVRATKEVGEIETTSGKIKLTKGSQYFMNRDEVANLIVQGFLEVID